ncbi:hypothetical protein HPB47_027226 [Ixodes persulcatus]|uniref:Uncharacterized protein n=1 Tax=Ixodes persulcatus TaxID=34615 RepID=A0AC60PWX7_IXOPE|nr:hypothetical protein HPB47_027226 [Ixodes persulcatus]
MVLVMLLTEAPSTTWSWPARNNYQDAARLQNRLNSWETAIRASDAEDQRQLVILADEASKANGTPDIGTTPG